MKVRKGDHIQEIQAQNLTVWEGRGYTLVRDEPEPEPKETPSVKAAAKGGKKKAGTGKKRKRSKKGTKAKP